jgi:hypothetical protein
MSGGFSNYEDSLAAGGSLGEDWAKEMEEEAAEEEAREEEAREAREEEARADFGGKAQLIAALEAAEAAKVQKVMRTGFSGPLSEADEVTPRKVVFPSSSSEDDELLPMTFSQWKARADPPDMKAKREIIQRRLRRLRPSAPSAPSGGREKPGEPLVTSNKMKASSDIWICEGDCGFESSSYETVAEHEEACNILLENKRAKEAKKEAKKEVKKEANKESDAEPYVSLAEEWAGRGFGGGKKKKRTAKKKRGKTMAKTKQRRSRRV